MIYGTEQEEKDFAAYIKFALDNSEAFLARLKERNILGGLKLNDNKILVCVTEMNTEDEIEDYINAI